MLVATAGHIDHGKTALVRALTGVETDRLPEEKARGITIDLAFAYWRPDGERTIGFIDVPGHERFVPNMLAGVGGIDLALLVIAADDGVMPQSLEHVQILDLLGVSRAFVAITKCDRVTPDRVDAVRAEADELLTNTALADAPVFPVSTLTGDGVEALSNALRDAGAAQLSRDPGGRAFRMAIDRAFSITGAGTVVTGTVLDGAVETGTRLRIAPQGLDVRVRGLQSAGAAVRRVAAGERCALNLTGVERGQVRRGDWLVTPRNDAPTSRLEARLRVLATRTDALKHFTPVHLHIGAADVEARVLIPGQGSISPGGEAVVHLALDAPACAVTGDRFVLRDQSARASIGGGRVIDPQVTGDKRGQGLRAPIAAAMELPSPAQALAALLAIPGHEVSAVQFEHSFNLEPAAAQALYKDAGAVLFGGARTLVLPSERIGRLRAQIVAALAAAHHAAPDAEGVSVKDLKAQVKEPISAEAFASLMPHLHQQQSVVLTGSVVKLPSHTARLSEADNALWRKLLPWLEERGAAPFTALELARELKASEAIVGALLHRKRALGEIWRITDERYLLRAQVAALAAAADQLARHIGGAGFTAAQYRDVIGTGRTWAIHILEFFDAISVTRRAGDRRKVRSDYALMVGAAEPYAPPPKDGRRAARDD